MPNDFFFHTQSFWGLLIPDVLADELVDRHERLGPLLVRVPGPDLYGDSAAASDFLDIL